MLYLMIFGVYVGAISVAWQQAHIRIDAVLDFAPPARRKFLEIVSTLVLAAVLVPVVLASFRVVSLLFDFDQRSDALHLPMWIPQSVIPISLLLIVRDVAPAHPRPVDRGRRGRRQARLRSRTIAMAALVLIGLPVVLLCLGVPIFVALIAAASIGIVAMGIGTMEPGARGAVRRPRQFSAAGGAAVHLRRRDHGAGRDRAPAGRMGAVDRRRRARLARAGDGRLVGAVRLHVGIERRLRGRHRAADGAGADAARLQRGVLRQPDRIVRRHRHHHSAVDHDDHLSGSRPRSRCRSCSWPESCRGC